MPRIPRAIACALAPALAALVAAGGAPTHAQEAGWTTFRLSGGPAYELAVTPVIQRAKPYDLKTQSVISAGTEVLVMDRGADWVVKSGTGPMVNVVAGPQGVAFVSSGQKLAYRTRDFGKTWGRINVRGDDPVRILAVSPDYAFDHSAYAITTTDWRLFDTSNEGGSWQEVKVEVDQQYENAAVAYSPLHSQDETTFVATSMGVYKWSRDVRKWTLMSKPGGNTPTFGSAGGPASSQGLVLPAEYGDDLDRAKDPVLWTVFAFNAQGVYRSDNDGETWTALTLPAGIARVNDLAISNGWPADPVLAIAVTAPDRVAYVSTDDGRTWRGVPGRDGLSGTSVAMSVDFAPIPDPDRFFRGTVYLPSVVKHAPADVDPPYEPYIGSREMFVATDGDGVYRSTDAGQTWSASPPSFTSMQVTALAFLPGGGGTVLAGTDAAGLQRSDDGGRTWSFVDSGLPRGAGQTVRALRVSPAFASDRTVFAATSSGLWASRDGGATFTRTTGPADARVLAISPAYASDRTLLCDGQLSEDAGATWRPLPGAEQYGWAAAAFSPDYATDKTVWWGTDDISLEQRYGLRKWDEASQSWKVMEDTEVIRSAVTSIAAIRVTASEPIRVFVGLERGLQQSFDNGAEWERAGPPVGGTRDIDARVLTQPYAGGVILSANAEGAVWSTSRGAAWAREPRSPRDARATAVSYDGGTLVVALPAIVAVYEPASSLLGGPRPVGP